MSCRVSINAQAQLLPLFNTGKVKATCTRSSCKDKKEEAKAVGEMRYLPKYKLPLHRAAADDSNIPFKMQELPCRRHAACDNERLSLLSFVVCVVVFGSVFFVCAGLQ